MTSYADASTPCFAHSQRTKAFSRLRSGRYQPHWTIHAARRRAPSSVPTSCASSWARGASAWSSWQSNSSRSAGRSRSRSSSRVWTLAGAATGGFFGVVIRVWPQGFQLKAINDAVGGAVAFALLGAVLGTLVERLAAPFLNRFEER